MLIISLLLFAHGFIHLTEFAAACYPDIVRFQKLSIPKMQGIIWLAVAALLIWAGIMMLTASPHRLSVMIPAVVVSQLLIVMNWRASRWGSIINLLLLAFIAFDIAGLHFRKSFTDRVNDSVIALHTDAADTLRAADIQNLPSAIRRYIRLSGALDKPRISYFKVEMSGRLRKDERSAWMPFHSVQYNSIQPPVRLFFLNAVMNGLPVAGIHSFDSGKAYMDIRLLSAYSVQYKAGPEMDTSETVTFFNDMCCLAPATLIDRRITWLDTTANAVKAAFTNGGITITACLYFNDAGMLVNFISDNRYAVMPDNTMKRLRWMTPLQHHGQVGDYTLPRSARAVYQYGADTFCYGIFTIDRVIYNQR